MNSQSARSHYRFIIPCLYIMLVSALWHTSHARIFAEQSAGTREGVTLKMQRSTFLYHSSATKATGQLALRPGAKIAWTGDAEMLWHVNVPADEKYDLYLIANIREEGTGETLSFTANGVSHKYILKPTSGPYLNGANFERTRAASSVSLPKGPRQVRLSVVR